jgi:hypothetical protein
MSVEDELCERSQLRLREIRAGVGKVQTPAWRHSAVYDLLDMIDEMVAGREVERAEAEAVGFERERSR